MRFYSRGVVLIFCSVVLWTRSGVWPAMSEALRDSSSETTLWHPKQRTCGFLVRCGRKCRRTAASMLLVSLCGCAFVIASFVNPHKHLCLRAKTAQRQLPSSMMAIRSHISRAPAR